MISCGQPTDVATFTGERDARMVRMYDLNGKCMKVGPTSEPTLKF